MKSKSSIVTFKDKGSPANWLSTSYEVTVEGDRPVGPNTILLPPLNILRVSFSIRIGNAAIDKIKYPALCQILTDKAVSAKIWTSLGYTAEVPSVCDSNREVQISVRDTVLNEDMMHDLKLSSIYETYDVQEIHFTMTINDPTLDQTHALPTLLNHINYLMLCNYTELEKTVPLVLSYPARQKYTSSFAYVTSLAETFATSKETAVIKTRAFYAGFLRQLCTETLEDYLVWLARRKTIQDSLLLEFFSTQ